MSKSSFFERPYFFMFSVAKPTCIETAGTCLQSNDFSGEKRRKKVTENTLK